MSGRFHNGALIWSSLWYFSEWVRTDRTDRITQTLLLIRNPPIICCVHIYMYVRCPNSVCIVSACVCTLNTMPPCDLPSLAKSSSTDYFRCVSININTTAITWKSRSFLDCLIGRLAAGTHVNYERDLNNQICNLVIISETLVQEKFTKKP